MDMGVEALRLGGTPLSKPNLSTCTPSPWSSFIRFEVETELGRDLVSNSVLRKIIFVGTIQCSI